MVNDDQGNEMFKIGTTKRPIEQRVSELQTGNAEKIKILNFYESRNYKTIEKWLHEKYHKTNANARNEWFYLTGDSLVNFKETCKEIDDTINYLSSENDLFKP